MELIGVIRDMEKEARLGADGGYEMELLSLNQELCASVADVIDCILHRAGIPAVYPTAEEQAEFDEAMDFTY